MLSLWYQCQTRQRVIMGYNANREKGIPSLNGSYGKFSTFLLNWTYALSDTTWKATVLVRSNIRSIQMVAGGFAPNRVRTQLQSVLTAFTPKYAYYLEYFSFFKREKSGTTSMNAYFSSVFTTEDYANFPTLDCIVDKKLESVNCSVDEVRSYLQKLKPYKSPGPDHIAPCILKSCARELAPSVTYMLNKPFSTGLLPEEWKHADITPLHKKGSKSLRENYRPISLTSIVCKIGEKIVFDRLFKFWRENNLINNNQFGFLRGRSTVTQLLSTINDWAKSRNLSIPTDVIFLDLAKAFDSVPHERLLLKLKCNGINGCLLNWLRHFLTDRKQRVVVRGTCPVWSSVTSGTPQGTILGPLLFLLYINDITECVSSTVKLYADDTKIYRELADPIIDSQLLQADLANLSEWACKWQLRFNADKCESMRITHSRDKSLTNYTLGKPLKDVNSFKDLGVTITKDLSWGIHISMTVNKANKTLGAIKRPVGIANTKIFSMLYKSLVRPILEYEVPVWCPYLVKDIHALECVQRRASRLALNETKRRDVVRR